MKFFYLGKFQYTYSTENYVTYALEQNGVQVIKRPYTSTGNLQSYTEQITKHQPDVVLFSKVSNECFEDLIDWCRDQGILTVCWLWDLYWGYRYQRPPQFLCDMLFTTDGGHANNWESMGANHQVLRQGIHEPEHIIYQSSPKTDLAFIGTTSSHLQRRRLAQWLNGVYRDRITWHTNLRGLPLNQKLAETKIIVGESYPSENYWSNRVYEILGRGGFLLFPETPGLDKEFTDGVHYVSYRRDEYLELEHLISYYLAHDKERESIRQAGFKKCGEYTYTVRTKELLGHIAAYRTRQAGQAT